MVMGPPEGGAGVLEGEAVYSCVTCFGCGQGPLQKWVGPTELERQKSLSFGSGPLRWFMGGERGPARHIGQGQRAVHRPRYPGTIASA